MLLEEAIEILTKMMIEDSFKDKAKNKESKVVMSKVELYKFCIKLLKLIQQEEYYECCEKMEDYDEK